MKRKTPNLFSAHSLLIHLLYFCLFFSLLIGWSASRLMAKDPKLDENKIWMGQVTITKTAWSIYQKDESTEHRTKTFSRNYKNTASITITVCGNFGLLKVTDVAASLSEFMEEQKLIKDDHTICPATKEMLRHNFLYRTKHYNTMKKPGNSESGRHSIRGTLHTSSKCGPYGNKGVKEPSVEVMPDFDSSGHLTGHYRLFASAFLLEDYNDTQQSEEQDVCTGKTKTTVAEITTSDCGVKPTGSISETFQTSVTPPLEFILGGLGEGVMAGNLISGTKTFSEPAKYQGDTSQQLTISWYLSTSPSIAYESCMKSAEEILKSCIDTAYHMYDSQMDRKKVESEGAICAEGYLVKCFQDAGSIADPKERGTKMSKCVEEHCNTDLFPDQMDSYLYEENLNNEIRNCTEAYLDRISECSRDYGCMDVSNLPKTAHFRFPPKFIGEKCVTARPHIIKEENEVK